MTYNLKDFYDFYLQKKKENKIIRLFSVFGFGLISFVIAALGTSSQTSDLVEVVIASSAFMGLVLIITAIPVDMYLRKRFKYHDYVLNQFDFAPIKAVTLQEFDIQCFYRDTRDSQELKFIVLKLDIKYIDSFLENPEIFMLRKMESAIDDARIEERRLASQRKAREIWRKK